MAHLTWNRAKLTLWDHFLRNGVRLNEGASGVFLLSSVKPGFLGVHEEDLERYRK